MILSDVRSRIPRVPLLLGLGGLVPFWGLALLCGVTPLAGLHTGGVAFALATYAATIVSFLGGIRWGLATAAQQGRAQPHYVIAVIPSLLAWAALALPTVPGLITLGVVALALGYLDQPLVGNGFAPPWYGRLRFLLSWGAGCALLLGAAIVAARL